LPRSGRKGLSFSEAGFLIIIALIIMAILMMYLAEPCFIFNVQIQLFRNEALGYTGMLILITVVIAIVAVILGKLPKKFI